MNRTLISPKRGHQKTARTFVWGAALFLVAASMTGCAAKSLPGVNVGGSGGSASTGGSGKTAGSSDSNGSDDSGSALVPGLTATYALTSGGGVLLHLTYQGNAPTQLLGNVCFEDNGTTYMGTNENIDNQPATVEVTMNPGTSYTIPDLVANASLPYVTAYFPAYQPGVAAGASFPSGHYYYVGQCSDPTTAEFKASTNAGS